MELPASALENSIVVVAHPDDEVLWFSSVLDRVTRIVVCFTDAQHSPEIGAARQQSLRELEFADRITLLDLEQVKSHNQSAWPEPEETDYGLRLERGEDRDGPFVEQAARLSAALEPVIAAASNVYTHNPWGEYGHEDHVQVCRVVTRLAGNCGARVWYSGYVSNKSASLMRRHSSGFGGDHYTMPVDTERARRLAEPYYRNGAWTFIDDYRWFDSECFVEGPLPSAQTPSPGWPMPVNFIRVPFDPYRAAEGRRLGRRLRRRLRRHARKPGTGEQDGGTR